LFLVSCFWFLVSGKNMALARYARDINGHLAETSNQGLGSSVSPRTIDRGCIRSRFYIVVCRLLFLHQRVHPSEHKKDGMERLLKHPLNSIQGLNTNNQNPTPYALCSKPYAPLTMSVLFVPPKPKALERNMLKGFSMVWETMLSFAENSSGFSKLILGAMKPFCIMRIE